MADEALAPVGELSITKAPEQDSCPAWRQLVEMTRSAKSPRDASASGSSEKPAIRRA
jgi:hypothetical protein